MGHTGFDDLGGLTAADVVHSRFTALPADATVGDVRAWLAKSSGRHVALLADEGRFVGSLLAEDLADEPDDARAAAELARAQPRVAPTDPADLARDVALAAPELRVPVVGDDGRLVGIVAITPDRRSFCGTAASTGC